MNELERIYFDDRVRLEKIRLRQPPLSLIDPSDVSWLLDLVEVSTFKVSNLTTERDVANQEIERLKAEKWPDQVFKLEETFHRHLTASQAKVEKLRDAAIALCNAAKDPSWLDKDRRTIFIAELQQAVADSKEGK